MWLNMYLPIKTELKKKTVLKHYSIRLRKIWDSVIKFQAVLNRYEINIILLISKCLLTRS